MLFSEKGSHLCRRRRGQEPHLVNPEGWFHYLPSRGAAIEKNTILSCGELARPFQPDGSPLPPSRGGGFLASGKVRDVTKTSAIRGHPSPL